MCRFLVYIFPKIRIKASNQTPTTRWPFYVHIFTFMNAFLNGVIAPPTACGQIHLWLLRMLWAATLFLPEVMAWLLSLSLRRWVRISGGTLKASIKFYTPTIRWPFYAHLVHFRLTFWWCHSPTHCIWSIPNTVTTDDDLILCPQR